MQFIDFATNFLDIECKYNQSRNELWIGKLLIRAYAANDDKMGKQKSLPTGIRIDNDRQGVINILDECAPDLKPELVNVMLQSIKTDFFKQVPKFTIYLANPWVNSNYYVSKWNANVNWNRLIATQPPFFKVKYDDGWCYIGASIYANPMCPETDFKTYWETTAGDKRHRDIAILGLPGALNGQIFDSFTEMHYEPFSEFNCYVGGIDIGWTDKGGNGGATAFELFKWSREYGMQGCLEYYHHNKDGIISSASQQTAILYKLLTLCQEIDNDYSVFINIDAGGGDGIAQSYQQEWDLNFSHLVSNKVYFNPVTYAMKLRWKLKDRYSFINECLHYNFLQVSNKIQPRLYSDLESAIYDEKPVKVEKEPEMMHEYSDTIVGGISYAAIGKGKIWLDLWKQRLKARRKREEITKYT